jgi:putative SOS response-associated peptidase YedK
MRMAIIPLAFSTVINMCGRYNIISDPLTQLLMDIVNGELQKIDLQTQYNIAPTESVPVLLKTKDGEWDIRDMRWWLIPFWADKPSSKYTMFNAKSETLSKSRAFREPFQRRRCVIPASGYYEWTKEGNIKVPNHIKPLEEAGFSFAGLWDRWRRDDKIIESCTIITGAAPDSMKDIHARVPIHLSRDEIPRWLDPSASKESLAKVLMPTSHIPLSVTPVSSYVGNSRNKDERCIEPLGDTRIIH